MLAFLENVCSTTYLEFGGEEKGKGIDWMHLNMTIRGVRFSLFPLVMLYTVLFYIAIAVAVLAVVVLAWLWYMGMFSRIHVSLREVPEMTIMFVVGFVDNMQ